MNKIKDSICYNADNAVRYCETLTFCSEADNKLQNISFSPSFHR